jgi:hypothetical protein
MFIYPEGENYMEHVNQKTHVPRQPLSTLSKVTVGALLVNACAEIIPLFLHLFGEGRLSVPLLVVSVLGLLMAALAASGIRWMPLLGGLVVMVTSTLAISQPENTYALLHPGADGVHFGILVILLASALVALVAGAIATLQSERSFATQRS